MQRAVAECSVFGRVTPQQKKQMVQSLQSQKHTVAMTGDGVNDVLALKEADCSIAMAAGSDAAKNIANVVLLDSNFGAMPHIVNQGRRVVNNIRSAASMFLIKTIFSVLLSLITIFFGDAYPFEPIQMSLISACAVGIPTFLLTQENNYNKIDHTFLRHVFMNAFPAAVTITGCVFTIMLVFEAQLEKYKGLVVTEENYKDMVSAKNEIVKYRTTLDKFCKEKKRELKRPIELFEEEVNEVLKVVYDAEKPLAEQIKYFDEKEVQAKTEAINKFIEKMVEKYGVREEYVNQLQHDKRWLNKTAKMKDIETSIEGMMIEISKRQQSDDDYKQILAEKKGMIEFVVDTCNQQYELTTPITFDECWGVVKDMPLDQARELINAEFAERNEMEEAARASITNEPIEIVEVAETKVGLAVTVYDLTEDDAKDLTDFLEMRGYKYKEV